MNINKNLTTINHTALKRTKANINYIVIHYVGALGDAKANTDYYKNDYRGASADFYVGFSGDIWQGNDYYTHYSWHCGGGFQSSLPDGGKFYQICTNKNSIGIEMCVRKKLAKTMNATDTDWYFEDATVNATARLVASLMSELDIGLDHVIRHFDVNKKICPNPFVYNTGKYTWDSFKKIVASYAGITISQPKDAFVERVGAIANKLMAETGILASVVTAQCCLETGYGLGSDAVALMKVNNLLGMKVDLINSSWSEYSVWKGKSISKKTPEVYSGKLVQITDHFRVYTDYEECIRDYEMFLLHVRNNKGLKYASVAGMTDPAAVIHKIRIGTGTDAKPEGYCTDPNYETKVLRIIGENNLTRFDVKGDTTMASKRQKLIDTCRAMNKTMLADIAAKKYWTYKNKNTQKISKTFDTARKTDNRKVNCACGVYWALIKSGVVPVTREAIQWVGAQGGFVFLGDKGGSESLKNALLFFHLRDDMRGKTVKQAIKEGLLLPGDIICYKTLTHTNIYLGDNESFDTGHANCTSSGEGAKFSKWICKTPYRNYQIAQVLRLRELIPDKKEDPKPKKTQYRVQSGAYKVKSNANRRSRELTAKQIKNTVEKYNDMYVVQLGKYTVKENAEKFAKDVAAKYRIKTSVEVI